MKLFFKIFIFLLLQGSTSYLLFGQSDCLKQIDDLQAQKNKLTSEKSIAISQLKQGKFCSVCKKSKIEIEKTLGISFEEHLKNVNGKEIPASPEVIKQKTEEYNKRLKDLDAQILSIKQNCKQNNITPNLNTDNVNKQNNYDNPVDNTFNPVSPIDNTFNPVGPVDNTYNPQNLVNNVFDDGKNDITQEEPTMLPEDLSDKLNNDALLCEECKKLFIYRDNQLIQDYDNAFKKYKDCSTGIQNVKDIVNKLKEDAEKEFKKNLNSQLPVSVGTGENAFKAGVNLQIDYSHLIVEYQSQLKIAYKIIETFLPIVLPASTFVFVTIDISASIINGEGITEAVTMGVLSVVFSSAKNVKGAMELVVEVANNLTDATSVGLNTASVASSVDEINKKNEQNKKEIITVNQNLDNLVIQLQSLEKEINNEKNSMSIIINVKNAIDKKCLNVNCDTKPTK